jgi:hypothetical protein
VKILKAMWYIDLKIIKELVINLLKMKREKKMLAT